MFVTTPAAPPSNRLPPSFPRVRIHLLTGSSQRVALPFVHSQQPFPPLSSSSLSLSLPSPLPPFPFLASSSSFSRESLTGFKDSVQSSARRSLKTGSSSSFPSLSLLPSLQFLPQLVVFLPSSRPLFLPPSLRENSESIVEFSREGGFFPRAFSLFSAFVRPKKKG